MVVNETVGRTDTMRIDIRMEDNILHASVDEDGTWSGSVMSVLEVGEERFKSWTQVQMGCVLLLLMAGDDLPPEVSEYAYKEAVPLFHTWDSGFRLIP